MRVRLVVVMTTIVAALAAPLGASVTPTRNLSAVSDGVCPIAQTAVQNAAPSVAHHKTVALTFDDGPGASTDAILKILVKYGVRASFLNVGASIEWKPAPVVQEFKDGFLLGDHTQTHPVMTNLSEHAQRVEIQTVARETKRLTGTWTCVFRPPYGDYDSATVAAARHDDETVWMWNDGGGDWEAKGSASAKWTQHIAGSIINQARGQQHPVVLLHNQRIPMPATISALPKIIRWFTQHHYAFVDLLGRTGPPDSCGVPTAAPFTVGSTPLSDSWTLGSGSSIWSPGNQYRLTMRPDGVLALTVDGGSTLWTTPTNGRPGATAAMASDGALEVRSSSGTVLWSSPNPQPGSVGHLRADGRIELVRGATVVWQSGPADSSLHAGDSLRPGWYLDSSNDHCRLVQTNSGHLALLTADGQTFWTSAALHASGAITTLDALGDLRSSTTGTVVWSTHTTGHSGDDVLVSDTGRVVIQRDTGSTIWATP